MNMTQQELFKAFESLPTEAQRQALNKDVKSQSKLKAFLEVRQFPNFIQH